MVKDVGGLITPWTIELPAVRTPTVEVPAPVQEITRRMDDSVTHAELVPDKELFEYMPRLKRRKAIPLGGADVVDEEEEEVEPEPMLAIEDGEGNSITLRLQHQMRVK